MIRLSEDDSVPRVEDACERHMRLCKQVPGADKYRVSILPLLNDFKSKKIALEDAGKEVNAAQDMVWLSDYILDDCLRNLHGRSKEFDRSNPGSNTLTLLFPNGNITAVITMSDKDEPDAAHAIAQKVQSLGDTHVLAPYAAEIETAIGNCRIALAQQETAIRAEGEAKTALTISKVNLVRQYNAVYFKVAGDVDKNYAEKLFPQLRSKKKNDQDDSSATQTDSKN